MKSSTVFNNYKDPLLSCKPTMVEKNYFGSTFYYRLIINFKKALPTFIFGTQLFRVARPLKSGPGVLRFLI